MSPDLADLGRDVRIPDELFGVTRRLDACGIQGAAWPRVLDPVLPAGSFAGGAAGTPGRAKESRV
jgi:hypothetical protein